MRADISTSNCFKKSFKMLIQQASQIVGGAYNKSYERRNKLNRHTFCACVYEEG